MDINDKFLLEGLGLLLLDREQWFELSNLALNIKLLLKTQKSI